MIVLFCFVCDVLFYSCCLDIFLNIVVLMYSCSYVIIVGGCYCWVFVYYYVLESGLFICIYFKNK